MLTRIMLSTRRWLLRHGGWLSLLLAISGPAAFVLSLLGMVRLRGFPASWFVFSLALALSIQVWLRWQRERHVREGALPQFLKRKLRQTYPHLTQKDADLVERGLRQFFMACLRSDRKFVAMPSQVVDVMWHEMILHTRAYRDWCDLALGRFLHHTPAMALGSQAKGNDGLRRAWYWTCKAEAIDPRRPTRLPLLFALDAKLQIPGGFSYLPDCSDILNKSQQGGDGQGQTYCGTSFTDSSYSGSADSFGDADASSDSGGDGGGDGGGGCGGD